MPQLKISTYRFSTATMVTLTRVIVTSCVHSLTDKFPEGKWLLNQLIIKLPDPSGRAVYGVGLRPLACWHCGFESRRGHGWMSLASVVLCQVEVSASSWSLVQKSPAGCGESCVIEKHHEWRGHSPRWAAAPHQKKKDCQKKTAELTNSTTQNLRWTDYLRHSFDQDNSPPVWNLKIYHHFLKPTALDSVLSFQPRPLSHHLFL
jgi:hypothetical protein